MRIIYVKDIKDIDIEEKNIALGFFDSNHKGHVKIFDKLKEISKGKKKALLTFSSSYKSSEYVYDLEVRLRIYENYNIDIVYVILRDSNFMNLKYSDFIKWLEMNSVSEVVCGKDFRFGKGAEGTVDNLSEKFKVHNIADVVDESNQKISTSKIIRLLKNGQVEKANEMLDSRYFMLGAVGRGNQLGRTIGFPTANIAYENILLQPGVYATSTEVDDVFYSSITNIGYNPTVNGERDLKVETFILNFNRDIYGEQIKIEFLAKMRDEKDFKTFEKLKKQLQKDKESRGKWNM